MALQELAHLRDVVGVVLRRDGAHAHARPLAHVIVKAGAPLARERHAGKVSRVGIGLQAPSRALPLGTGCHAHRHDLAKDVDGLARGTGVGVGAKVARAALVPLARVLDGRERVGARDGYEGVALVVLEIDVEVRVVLRDEVALQHQRLVLGAHDDVVKVGHQLHHEGDLLAVVGQRGVLAHARAEVLGLAHVDDLARRVLPQVAAGLGGDAVNLAGDGRVHGLGAVRQAFICEHGTLLVVGFVGYPECSGKRRAFTQAADGKGDKSPRRRRRR